MARKFLIVVDEGQDLEEAVMGCTPHAYNGKTPFYFFNSDRDDADGMVLVSNQPITKAIADKAIDNHIDLYGCAD